MIIRRGFIQEGRFVNNVLDNKKLLKEKIIAGINRFIAEMPPYWDREAIRKLVLPYDIEDNFVQDILKELEADGIIHLAKDNEHYFIISENLMKQLYLNDLEIANFRVKQINELMKKYFNKW